jgi:fumarate hydratase subunit beta
MSEAHRLHTPLSEADLAPLHIGDRVLLSGVIYTARDAAHKRIIELLDKGQPLPFDLAGQVIYYAGPTPAPPGKPIGSIGPTTSYRMDAYTPLLLEHGLKAVIGKGRRSPAVRESLAREKAVYLVAIGGAAVLQAQAVRSARVVAWEDLGAEAVRELVVEDFMCIVANDLSGNDIYQNIQGE